MVDYMPIHFIRHHAREIGNDCAPNDDVTNVWQMAYSRRGGKFETSTQRKQCSQLNAASKGSEGTVGIMVAHNQSKNDQLRS